MGIANERRRDFVQLRQITDGRARDNARVAVAHKTNYSAPVCRKPKIDARIENLI